jgi:hypothetical protein
MDAFAAARDKSQWDWTMMIMQPAWITVAMFDDARAVVEKQKNPPTLANLRLATYE